RRREPLCQNFAAILAGRDRWRLASQELRRHALAPDWIAHFAAAAIEHHEFTVVFTLLPTDLSEECGKTVVIVHRPAIERMIVALGTLRADAAEHLSDVLRRLQRVPLDVEISRRWILQRPA